MAKPSRSKFPIIAAFAFFTLSGTLITQAAPRVVASIAPLHSITAAIMQGIGTPDLLVEQTGSPHATALKPSDAKALQEADLVVWAGPALEAFLIKPMETLAGNAHSLPLLETKDLTLLDVRQGDNWAKHVHEDGEHEHEHDADHEDDHDHEAHDQDIDPHAWLDPKNGILMASAIAKTLSILDPDNASRYAANEKAFSDRMNKLTDEAGENLAGAKGKSFIVFHDAYHYLENRFGLEASGSVMLQPGVNPGAARVKEIQHKLKDLNAVCLFSEPQFSSRLLPVLTEGTGTRLGELDPIGANLKIGPDLYPELIAYDINALSKCLNGN